MQSLIKGKKSRSLWREQRLADEAGQLREHRLARYAMSLFLSIFSIETLAFYGLLMSLPFLLLAVIIYLQK